MANKKHTDWIKRQEETKETLAMNLHSKSDILLRQERKIERR
jgi:hypothetical protein